MWQKLIEPTANYVTYGPVPVLLVKCFLYSIFPGVKRNIIMCIPLLGLKGPRKLKSLENSTPFFPNVHGDGLCCWMMGSSFGLSHPNQRWNCNHNFVKKAIIQTNRNVTIWALASQTSLMLKSKQVEWAGVSQASVLFLNKFCWLFSFFFSFVLVGTSICLLIFDLLYVYWYLFCDGLYNVFVILLSGKNNLCVCPKAWWVSIFTIQKINK